MTTIPKHTLRKMYAPRTLESLEADDRKSRARMAAWTPEQVRLNAAERRLQTVLEEFADAISAATGKPLTRYDDNQLYSARAQINFVFRRKWKVAKARARAQAKGRA